MLVYGKQLYAEANIIEGVECCQSVIDTVPDMLEELEENTSDISWKIDDKPELELPSEYEIYLSK